MRNRNLIVVSLTILALTSGLLLPYDRPDVLIEVHLEMWHYRTVGYSDLFIPYHPDPIMVPILELLDYSHHPGVLTNGGADFAEDQLGDSPATDPAKWIGVSNDATAPSVEWTEIPTEITTGGMGRAVATYTNDGTGQWNMTVTFSPTASGSCQLAGLYWSLAGTTLFCADQFTQVNYENGDSLQLRFSLTLSGS